MTLVNLESREEIQAETKTEAQKFHFISEHKKSYIAFATTAEKSVLKYTILKGKSKEKIEENITIQEFIDVKGWRANGNKLSSYPVSQGN